MGRNEMMMRIKIGTCLGLLLMITATAQQQKQPKPAAGIQVWLTTPDRSALLQQQPALRWHSKDNGTPVITIDPAITFQQMDGFGFTLTGGSADLIHSLPEKQQDALLKELFLPEGKGIGISYIRLSIGASDLSDTVFTYDDMPAGQSDPDLQHFSMAREQKALLPVLKKIRTLHPAIKILGSPWSAPVWMKTNSSFIGGSLQAGYYAAYARYFVKYVQAMQAAGIRIDAITPQNEPLHPGNNPSMYMEAAAQGTFVKDHLGPAFRAAGITTKIILYDHNCDRPDYPLSILKDPAAYPFVDGSAFHLYAGDISALSVVHDQFPEKHIYFTEQWSDGKGSFSEELKGNVSRLIIGACRNWSRNVLQWNLAADPQWHPHTDQGGCTQCLGAITIDGTTITRNVSYYVIGHAAKFVPAGSVRMASTTVPQLDNVAFRTPDHKTVLIVVNRQATVQSFQVRLKGRWMYASLPAGAVATYVCN
ncbi:glycoside hydrolase family 30 protein [Chitinophaga nivalis]|uniref:Glucosylceramidase n=1 Tax=Chitinophaga nivalis TaxID=2991709 RepID=A0ABT3IG97_9BACT|nr:glycoside hydrolase family 30 beta sandwich domain-containing protein [Chitinophaga nivalis]MCW3467330.1 glucosylceramidase [Chitinophaga nivalis]MCW3482978.1 glucosylceramidase [Chitinophaga nivalis]